MLILLFFLLRDGSAQVDLSPAKWGRAELEKYVRIERIAEPVSRGESAMVTGTSSSIALRSGLEALKQGGSAMDAALTIALTHITLAGGCTVSFAGVLTVVYFDASSGQVFALDGGYDTVECEEDPLTIPRSSTSDPSLGSKPIPKGRTVLVGGFMAGLEATHKRFGKLPFPEIFKPAIYFAEEGFPISAELSRRIKIRKDIFSRLPETKAVYLKKDGSLYAPGEIFKQPALAQTLRRIAEEGATYFYRGAWAAKFVKAVRRDGGRMTMKDMATYEARWDEPLHAHYRGYDVYLPQGGIHLTGMLNLLEVSDVAGLGYYADAPSSLYWFHRIIEAVQFGTGLDGMGYQREAWLKKEFAQEAWEKMQKDPGTGKAALRNQSASSHSDAVVAMDKSGNLAAVLHSSNCLGFGESGLNIDGISIPDSATFQQAALSHTKPGERLFNPTTPLIVLKKGKPYLGLSAIGSGIYEETIKCLFNILGFNKNAQEAIDAPFVAPFFGDAVDAPSSALAVPEGVFSDELLEKTKKIGLELKVIPYPQARRRKGAAAIITVDPSTGIREGASVRRFSLGY
jgi:gamma-glutamyltranspeptidase/glutathione hydrolase